jgi:hypothetical protein
MFKKTLAIIGVALFIVAIGLSLYLANADSKAKQLSKSEMAGGGGGPGARCEIASINAPTVMSDQDSQTVTVNITKVLSNPKVPSQQNQDCSVPVRLSAPGFDYSPSDYLTITIPPQGKTTQYTWTILPKKLGTYKLVVYEGETSYHAIGITVTNIFGLRAWQAQLLSTIGKILGPFLVVPSAYELWKEWRKRKAEKQAVTETIAH